MIFPAVATGAALMWLRLKHLQRVSRHMHNAMNTCQAAVLANMNGDDQARNSASAVALIPAEDLKKVYRFRDVRQVCTHWLLGHTFALLTLQAAADSCLVELNGCVLGKKNAICFSGQQEQQGINAGMPDIEQSDS